MTTTADQPDTGVEKPAEVTGFRDVLKNRNFLQLWLAQLISQSVLNGANFGIVVLVNDTTHSALLVGVAFIAFTLPAVPFSAAAGVIVDHMNKRTVLWVSNILRMVTMLLVVVSLLIDRSNLWPLYILAFMTSLIGQFFAPAEGAAIPLLVGKSEVAPAVSLFNITLTLSQAIGFLFLGSLLTILPTFTFVRVQLHAVDTLFLIITLLYLVCALLILGIPMRAFHEKHTVQTEQVKGTPFSTIIKTLWHDIVQGWLFVRGNRTLFLAVIQLSTVSVVMLLIAELAGTFVQVVFHKPAADMALILAPAAVGLVLASIFMPRITHTMSKQRLIVIGLLVMAAGFLLLPVSQWVVWQLYHEQGASSVLLFCLVTVLSFVLGAAIASVNVPSQTLVQELTVEEVRARVLALQFMLYNTVSIPILLFAGAITQFIGLDQLLFLLAGCTLLFCWWGVWYARKPA